MSNEPSPPIKDIHEAAYVFGAILDLPAQAGRKRVPRWIKKAFDDVVRPYIRRPL